MIEVIAHLVPHIMPLYALIAMGYVAGKYFSLQKESLAILSIYLLVPFVMFYGIMKSEITIGVLVIPFAVCIFSSIACLIEYKIAKKFLPEKTMANILGLAAGTGNSGYFGLPVAILLFGEKGAGIYLVTILGLNLFQNTVGFYLTSRGNMTAEESLKKVLKLPVIYAFIIGVICNSAGLKIPDFAESFFTNIRGTYIVIGMMIIGLGLSTIEEFTFNFRFTAIAMLGRNIIWPAIAAAGYFIDHKFFGVFNEDIKNSLILVGIIPLAADTVSIASLLDCHPEDMATAVIISSLFAIIYVPVMVKILL